VPLFTIAVPLGSSNLNHNSGVAHSPVPSHPLAQLASGVPAASSPSQATPVLVNPHAQALAAQIFLPHEALLHTHALLEH
jgi:hypothetical protein